MYIWSVSSKKRGGKGSQEGSQTTWQNMELEAKDGQREIVNSMMAKGF